MANLLFFPISGETVTSATKCKHCKNESETGTRGGCLNCGKVKHTSGRKNVKESE